MYGGVASKGRRAVVGIEEWLVVTNRVGCREELGDGVQLGRSEWEFLTGHPGQIVSVSQISNGLIDICTHLGIFINNYYTKREITSYQVN